jgi:hypothetical protein
MVASFDIPIWNIKNPTRQSLLNSDRAMKMTIIRAFIKSQDLLEPAPLCHRGARSAFERAHNSQQPES